MDNGPVAILAATLPPLITAAIAALGLWLAERRKDRDDAERRLKAIGEETAHLSYLRSWLKTEQLAAGTGGPNLESARREVCAELASSRERLARVLEAVPENDKPSALLRAWRKAMLLPLRRPASRTVAWFYRSCLILAVLGMALAISADYTNGITFGVAIVVGLIFALPFLGAALGFRAWAVSLERRTPTPGEAYPGAGQNEGWHQANRPPNFQATPFNH